jgi:FtsH-binding integral membrane protein
MTTKRAVSGDQYFYFAMSLLITAIVIYGFSHTVSQNLFHPDLPRPWILWVHGALFSGWLLFFILQSTLIRTRNVRVHRNLGWFGVALGAAIVVVGISTSIIMARYEILYHHATDAAPFLIVPFLDVTCFAIVFALAIYWRKKPEYHRRLMLVATCLLTSAAFGRFPTHLHEHWFYAGVDLLIVIAIVRDLVVSRVHPVYLYALPVLIVAQTFAVHLYITAAPGWVNIANAILR